MKKKFRMGIFVGRFQPFHKGHLHALRFAKSHCDTLIVGVGSSNEVGTLRNPLSARDRIGIIRAAIDGVEGDSKGIVFFEIPDLRDNEKWLAYILRRYPGIDVVFSRHWLVKKIFREHGIRVVAPAWYKRDSLAATRIRNDIRHGSDRWMKKVPRGAIREIERHESEIRRT